MNKKIIIVSNTSWSIIKFRLGLIKELINQGCEVTVVSPLDEYTKDIKLLGCYYKNINIDNKGSNPIKDIILILNLKKIYKSINPDLIIHYTIKPNIYGTIASGLLGINSFAVVTGLGFIFINNTTILKIAKLLYKFSFSFSTKVFFINNDDKNEFINNNLVDINKVVLIPGEGINTNFFIDNSINKNKNIKFLLISRMLYDKGIVEYVIAANLLKNKYSSIEFGLLGYLDVDNPKAVKKKQMDVWVKDCNIKFYGATTNVKDFICSSDCIVLPSYREGVSMSLMESASMSKPLIATNVPGCKDLIDDGVNGYLCEVRNPQDLADKMEKMLNLSNNARLIMGQKGRAKMIKEFDEKIVINKYLNTIRKII